MILRVSFVPSFFPSLLYLCLEFGSAKVKLFSILQTFLEKSFSQFF